MLRKSILFILLISIFFMSCKKEDEAEYTDVFGDIIYTDSFSPKEWENPVARKKINAVDKDIGKFINKDVTEPKLRTILKLIESFIENIRTKNHNLIQKSLTPSAFNSFALRIPDITFEKNYDLRVAYPENIDQKRFWIEFKILFLTKSIITKIQFEHRDNQYFISDFENKFFDDLEAL